LPQKENLYASAVTPQQIDFKHMKSHGTNEISYPGLNPGTEKGYQLRNWKFK